MSSPPKAVGNKSQCSSCKMELICRMTNYQGGYDNYPQWQNKTENKAHFTKGGKCTITNQAGTAEPLPREIKADGRDTAEPIAVGGTDPMVITSDTIIQSPSRLPEVLTELHDKCWAFANIEADKVWPVKIKHSEGYPDVDVNEKSRNILAQVFYKALMDAATRLKY